MSQTNRQIVLAARPVGFPKESDFRLVESPMPSPGEGQMLVRSIYLSLDPYMRGRMNDAKSYADPVQIGEVMIGGSAGQVVESRHPEFQPGEYVNGMFGWQEYAISDGQGVRRLDPEQAPIATALGVLGMPGMTAYFGLLEVCKPVREGETVVVSAGAGAVGATVGQIAKLKGCRVVGIAGSQVKVNYMVQELGFDAAWDYKQTTDYRAKLEELCPAGIDIYFDNVGGPITDAVFPLLNIGARVAVCGQISQYNAERPELGPRLFWHLIVKRARVQGFLVFDFADRFREAMSEMAPWVAAGKIRFHQTVVVGLESAPRAFIGLFQGANLGKLLVRVSEDSSIK